MKQEIKKLERGYLTNEEHHDRMGDKINEIIDYMKQECCKKCTGLNLMWHVYCPCHQNGHNQTQSDILKTQSGILKQECKKDHPQWHYCDGSCQSQQDKVEDWKERLVMVLEDCAKDIVETGGQIIASEYMVENLIKSLLSSQRQQVEKEIYMSEGLKQVIETEKMDARQQIIEEIKEKIEKMKYKGEDIGNFRPESECNVALDDILKKIK
jgi:hypothetical protein